MKAKPYHHLAILLLGGSGERFHSDLPKQFIKMGRKELGIYAAEILSNSKNVDFIVYVVPNGYVDRWEALLKEYKLEKIHATVVGGNSRSESSFNAVRYLKENNCFDERSLVLIQDGDRPNLREEYIDECYIKADEVGSAIVALPITSSLLIDKDGGIRYVDRTGYHEVQTPQCFRFDLYANCINSTHENGVSYSDDASMVMSEIGIAPAIVLGSYKNYKVTVIEDGERLKEEKK